MQCYIKEEGETGSKRRKAQKKNLAKDRKMRNNGDKDWVKEELKEKKQRERMFSFLI